MNTTLRIPTNREYDQLIKVTGGDDAKMHWKRILSWVNDTKNEYELKALRRAYRGYISARNYGWSTASERDVRYGFRPACSLLPETLAHVKDGEQVVLGTLDMNDSPVKVPQIPNYSGDITSYVPGASLELRKPLDDPDFQVMGYRIGNAAVADRCLLNMISYADINKAAVSAAGSGMNDLKPSICLNGQTFSVEEVTRVLGIQEDIQTVRLCQPCRSGTILAELDLREEELPGIDLALQIPAEDSTEEFLVARCSQRVEGTRAPRVEVYGRRGGYIAYGPLDTRSLEQVKEDPERDELIVGGGQYEGVLNLYVEDESYVNYRGTRSEVNFCHD